MYAKYIKSILDFILSVLALIILVLPFTILAIIIKIDSKGPVFFKQKRIGKNGKEFYIYKFRSMIVNAENQGSGNYSFKGDPRVTKIGKFIRMTSMDELPQLLNILKGEMSIIGPRPVLTYHPWRFEEYTERQKTRFDVRPGVTGWAQINGRKEIEWKKRIELDTEYVEKLSFLFDLKIFFKTIYDVILMKNNVNTKLTVNKEKNINEGAQTEERNVTIDVHN